MNIETYKIPTNNSIYINSNLSMRSGDWEFIEYSGSPYYDSLNLKGNHRSDLARITKLRVRVDLENHGYRLANDHEIDFFLGVMGVEGMIRNVYYMPDKFGKNVVDRIDWVHENTKGAR